MKKLLALLLVAVLAASMSISGFAASVTTSGNTTGDVNVKINSDELDPDDNDPDNPKNPVYYVVIEWDSLDFTYTLSSLEWDPVTHNYPGIWNKSTAEVKVTNHSNAAVAVSATFASTGATEVTTNSVTATLTDNSFDLETAVGTDANEAPSDTAIVTVNGHPSTTVDYKVDTINVAISAK